MLTHFGRIPNVRQPRWAQMRNIGPVRLTIAFLIAVLLCGIAGANHNNETDTASRREILQIEDRMKLAIMAGDLDVLDRIYADNMMWTARGELRTKAQVFADFRSGRLRNNSLEHSNIQVRIYGNTVVLTGHSASQLVFEGKVLNTPRTFSDAFIKLDGRWQLVAHAVTDIER
jgi:Domain of unknown function (DUF4440)